MNAVVGDPKQKVTRTSAAEYNKLMDKLPQLNGNLVFCEWPKTDVQMQLLIDYLQTRCHGDPLNSPASGSYSGRSKISGYRDNNSPYRKL